MKQIEKIIYTVCISVITGMPLINFLRYCNFLTENQYYKYFRQSYLIYILLPVLLIVYLYSVIKKYYEVTYVDIIIYILILLGIISTIFAIDISKSIFGEVTRYEGFISLCFYYFLFLNVKNFTNEKYKKNIIKVLLGTALVQFIYSFLQVYTTAPFVIHFTQPYMAFGTEGNPNFYGSYMVMCSLITIVLYFMKSNKIYLILSIIFFICLCLASSTGPILGFTLAYIFLFVIFFKKINIKKFIFLTSVLIALFFTVDKSVLFVHENFFNNTIEDAYNIKKELKNSFANISNNDFGNGRLRIWLNTIPAVKEYFLFGCGIDNFAEIYPHPRGLVYDKAHNIYLQMLVTNGVFALEAYCALCLVVFIKGFKLKKPFEIALYIAFIGYSIQAFVNISVIDVAPIFYIILAFLYSHFEKE